MKQSLNIENLRELSKESVAPAISIYMPLKISGKSRGENKIRLENLLKIARTKLIGEGAESNFAEQMLAPVSELLDNGIFWRRTTAAGLALFITPPQIHRYFELPDPVEESLRIGTGFHLDPLREIVGKNRDFYLLVSSKKGIALYRGANGKLEKQNVSGLPDGIKSLVPDKKFEKKLESHGSAPAGKMEIIHGQGRGKETDKILVLKYFQIAGTALGKFLAKRKEPLMFAGTENLYPLYRKANIYPHLTEKRMAGNFDDIPLPELYKKAINLLKTTG